MFVLERLRLVDGEPMSFQASYLPAALGEEVVAADLAVTPLRQVLAFKLGIEIAAARETVSAVPLERRAARELGCRPGHRRASAPTASRWAPTAPRSSTTASSFPATASASPARSRSDTITVTHSRSDRGPGATVNRMKGLA